MKRVLALTLFTVAAFGGACSGDDGAAGPPGPAGSNGMDGMDGMNGTPGTPGTPGQNLTGFAFRTDPPTAYTRVDRMGMPAVSTVLVLDTETYNDADPEDDVVVTSTATGLPQFVESDMAGQLAGLHEALRDDIAGAGLTRCSTGSGATIDVLPCVNQEVAPGVSVADLIVPDTLTVDPFQVAGFPNGRRLQDPVIDLTLSIILLDQTQHPVDQLVGGVNPTANDVPFLSQFPYLGFPHAN